MENNNTMDITIRVAQNADNTTIAAALRMRAGLFEGMTAKEAASNKNAAPSKTAGKKAPAKSFDDDDDGDTGFGDDAETNDDEGFEGGGDDVEAADDEENFDEEPKKAPAKKAKITIAQVNDACKARARAGGEKGRAQVLKLLKQYFKTESVSEIKPEQYPKVLEVMKVKKNE